MSEMICILCPMGCALQVNERSGEISVSGNGCLRGASYGRQELTNPMRVVTTSVGTSGAALPLCPAKTAAAVPKGKIAEVLRAARSAHAEAPMDIGDVLIANVADTGVDLVATANR